MKLINKVKWIVGLLLVFLLILATNLIDRRNFKKIRNSMVSIYEDRLIAKGLVYEIRDLVHRKELAVTGKDSVFFTRQNLNINLKLDTLFAEFSATRLTNFEESVYEILSREMKDLYKIEKGLAVGKFENSAAYFEVSDMINKKLKRLADIQMKEGKRLFSNSEGVLNSMQLHTQVEMYFLVAIAIIIQIVIVIKPKD